MPVPTGYTDATFATFVRDEVLQEVASVLAWTDLASAHYGGIATETLLAAGVADFAAATDVRLLRLLGRREAWHAVAQATASDYDYTGETAGSKRSQVHQQAMALWRRADEAVREYRAGADTPESGADPTVAGYPVRTRAVW